MKTLLYLFPVTVFIVLLLLPKLVLGESRADGIYRQGLASMEAGNYKNAVAQFAAAVRLEPLRPEFQCAYAFALWSSSEVARARKEVRRCLELDPNAPGALFVAGNIEASTRNYAAAIPYLKEAYKQEADNISVLSVLAGALSGLGRSEEAAVYFRKLTLLSPRFPEDYYEIGSALLELSEPSKAEKVFRQALQLDPHYLKARIGLANSILAQADGGEPSRLGAALAAFRDAMKSDPKNPELHADVAFVLSRIGDTLAALSEYQEVLRLRPNPDLAQLAGFNLGVLYFTLGDWKNVQRYFREAVTLDGKDYEARYYLGSALLKTGDRNGAEEHLLAALKLDPEDPRVHFQLGALCRANGNSNGSAAEYQKFRELTARQEVQARADALEHSAQIILRKGDAAQGVETLRQLYQTRPDTSSARNLALALFKTGNIPEAKQLLAKAMAMSPSDPVTCNYFGLLQAYEGDLAAAQQYFEKAAILDPSYEDALYNAGVAAAQLGRTDIAMRHLQAALEISNSPQTRKALAMVYADAGDQKDSDLQFEAAQKLEAKSTDKQYLTHP